jgi:hypothetical protein
MEFRHLPKQKDGLLAYTRFAFIVYLLLSLEYVKTQQEVV